MSSKTQQRLDKVIVATQSRIEEEVGALMGVEFELSEFFCKLVTKEDYFLDGGGKVIVAKMDITGEIEGKGGLVVELKDAIRLGGTLIMLPPAELEEVVRNEEYTEESEDSYGEIANIIAGSFTKVFEDMFPKNCRFVRKEQELVASLKVDIASDEPIPDQYYYLAQAHMKIDGLEMGNLDFLIPAQPFGLEIPEAATEPKTEQEQEKKSAQEAREVPQQESIKEAVVSDSPEEPEEPEEQEEKPKNEESKEKPAKKVDLEKQKKLVDKLLKACQKNIGQEVGALLGVDVLLSNMDNRLVSKEDLFLDEFEGKQVLTRMEVVDGLEEKSFLFVRLKDAIRIGSILIMLPPNEIEVAVGEDEFSVDAEDAYGEIANIIAGVYTSVFQEEYTQSLRFIKKELEVVAPMKVDIESDDCIEPANYYLNKNSLEIDGKSLGNIYMVFPAGLFELEALADNEKDDVEVDTAKSPTSSASQEARAEKSAGAAIQSSEGGGDASSESEKASGNFDVLVVENDEKEADKIDAALTASGFQCKRISFVDNINQFIGGGLKLIFVVTPDVNEQAYGVIIKINALCKVPMVAAGPGWTRSKVIKAVKYGVSDILLTPAGEEDIQEKIHSNCLKFAA